MPLHLTECRDKDFWDRFVRASPQSNVFCVTPFLGALGEDYNLFIVEDDGEPVLGAVMITRNGQPIMPPYPYQGVLLGDALSRLPQHRRILRTLEVTDFLIAELEKRYRRIFFSLHYRFPDLRSFLWFHYHEPHRGQFKVELQYTGLIDLAEVADFDNYLASLRRVRRQEYRYAQSHGFRLEPSTDIELLDRLNALTFKRQGIERDPIESRWIRSISRAALEHGIGELLVCIDTTGFISSAILTLYDERCAYALAMGNDPDQRKSGSGIFIFLENFRRFQAQGLKTLDFLGINSPKRGDFKTSLGATPVPHFMVSWEHPANSHRA